MRHFNPLLSQEAGGIPLKFHIFLFKKGDEMKFQQAAQDYQRIEKAIQFIETHFQTQPSLAEIAAAVNMSEHHFQKVFSRWVGISPKRFMQYLSKETAKVYLSQSQSVLSAAHNSGLSGPGRLHNLFIYTEAVSPGEYKNHGKGLEIFYGFHPTPFGDCLVALSKRGVTNLMFVNNNVEQVMSELKQRWRNAHLIPDQKRSGQAVRRIFPSDNPLAAPLHLHIKGSNFQIKVWEALLSLPAGILVTYEDIAQRIEKPRAVRAVATAIGNNPIAYLIPCHCVIRKSGDFNQYRWGSIRKKIMIAWELSRVNHL
jgi:AraC family transcriptional regulator of adaptative response/methylated-DNA-[protein]-cysteine methyltransferase